MSGPASVDDGAGGQHDSDSLPFSFRNEVRYFFCKSIPLCFAAFMNWGIPPLVAMSFAGHTAAGSSAHLQASLGYARVWYNCTMQMPIRGLQAYVRNVIPGCIGANRKDRIPRYLHRSVVLMVATLLPACLLQLFAAAIMHVLGAPRSNAEDVGAYCRVMIATAMLDVVNSHLETALINLGYVKCSTLNSAITGLGVDITCNYLFVLRWGWGVHGAALARVAVQLCRLVVWGACLCRFGILRLVLVPTAAAEPLFSRSEFCEFVRMGVPQIASFVASWAIFELQLMCAANIRGVSQGALAAAAIWVQFEGALAAAQEGWIQSASMRALALLGKQDPGARQAFMLFHGFSAAAVALINVLLVAFQGQLCRLESNDPDVQGWLLKIFWILVLHTQTRISALVSLFIYIPVGRGLLQFVSTLVCFYCIGAPVACVTALTGAVTTSMGVKLGACVGLTTIAQLAQAIFNFAYLQRLDWHRAGVIINRRANMDKREPLVDGAALT